MAARPAHAHFAVAGDSGLIQIWNYLTKSLVTSKDCRSANAIQSHKYDPDAAIHCLQYSKSGKTLAVGFANGNVRFMDANKLEDLLQTVYTANIGHKITNVPITCIEFSAAGNICAAADAGFVVSVFQKTSVKAAADIQDLDDTHGVKSTSASRTAKRRIEWAVLGRTKVHFGPIISLLFPNVGDDEVIILNSISSDRHIAEYNLTTSTVTGGLVVVSIKQLEQIYRPTVALFVDQPNQAHPEQFITTFNTNSKVRSYAQKTKLCRKTVLGPTLGALVTSAQLLNLPDDNIRVAAFATRDKVIGLMKIPADGNPFNNTGVIGHPGEAYYHSKQGL